MGKAIRIAFASVATLKTATWFSASNVKQMARVNAYLIISAIEFFAVNVLIKVVLILLDGKISYNALFGVPLMLILIVWNANFFDKKMTAKAIAEFNSFRKFGKICVRLSVFAVLIGLMGIFVTIATL